MQEREIAVEAVDGSSWRLLLAVPDQAHSALLWIPALGASARAYRLFARTLAEHGFAVAIHEWRGIGSSSVRAGRRCDWGYRTLLEVDLPASRRALAEAAPGLPMVLGGHSLGGQLAALSGALDPAAVRALLLVASGLPHPPTYPLPARWLMPLVLAAFPLISRLVGHLPGRRLGFAGRESRSVIRDWAHTGKHGSYCLSDLPSDIEARMAALEVPLVHIHLARDWLAPAASLAALRGKLANCPSRPIRLDSAALGTLSDHFSWMRSPERLTVRVVSELEAVVG